jgi:cyanate lyase
MEEGFGDGPISAIAPGFDLGRVANPRGERVRIATSGAFRPPGPDGNGRGIRDFGFRQA